MSTLTCDIVTPAAALASTECYMVVVPGSEGEMGFLEDHAPLVSTLADGQIRLLSDNSTVQERYCMQGGYVQVTGKKVIVLADRAVPVSEIDKADAAEKLAEAQERLAGLEEDDPDRALAEADIRWFTMLQNASTAR